MKKQVWIVALVASCSGGAPKATLPAVGDAAPSRVAQTVEVGSAVRAPVSAPVRTTGTTRPTRAANLATAASARIEKILVKEGDQVRQGQALLRLDARAAELAVSQAEATAAALHSQAARLATDHARLAPLAQKGAIAQSRVDQLATQRDATQSQAAAADAATNAARRAAADATLSAPFAGTVVSVPVEVGEMSGNGTVVRLIDLSIVEVSVRVSERDLSRVAAGDAVRATFPGLGSAAEGKVARVGLEVDPSTRTAELIVELPNPKGTLRSGAFVELDVIPSVTREAILIPRSAMASEDALFVIEGSVAKRRTVRAQPFDDTRLEVTEGLKGTELIALSGADRLAEGTLVRATEAVRAEAQ